MLQIGWASCDLTPEYPVQLAGQFHARVSEGVMDPVTATALALESDGDDSGNRVIIISCDLVSISEELRDAVQEHLRLLLPNLNPTDLFLNATHTHTAPEVRVPDNIRRCGGGFSTAAEICVELGAMAPAEYVAFAAQRIAEAVAQAWQARRPGGISFGLGHAVVGHNRRIAYATGETRMYGNTNDPAFSHVEGHEDHSVNVLCTWGTDRRLTGLVVNVACPSQVSEQAFMLSADYWHETREELRRRLGTDIFVLAQCSAAGDQSPHIQVGKAAEARMWRLKGHTQRQEIAVRLAGAVTGILPYLEHEVDWNPPLAHRVEKIALSPRLLTEADVREAMAEADTLREKYLALSRDLADHPESRQTARWYVDITAAYHMMRWNERVAELFARQQTDNAIPVEIHILRLGDMALATNPFEYYLDFGQQIKARSRAVQTFVVQLAGSGTYLPTSRAIAGKSYGAVAASTPVGPEGGRELVEWTVAAINALWENEALCLP